MEKKLVFVTGGSGGIGENICKLLTESGFDVVVGYYKNKTSALSLSKKLNTLSVQVDISKRSSIIKAIQKTQIHFGHSIDILINNAAISQEKPFENITDDDWDEMLVTNLKGVFSFSQEVLPKMKKKKFGRIINIASIGGQWGGYNQVHYAAAKAGVINFTKSLAKLYSKFGITSNTVSPGLVMTKMSKKEINSKSGKKKIASIPVGRLGTADEISHVVKFLCSEESSYVTGQTINVNGGMYFNS